MMNTTQSAQKRELAVSAVLLFIAFVTVCPVKAQLRTVPIALQPGKTVRRPAVPASYRARAKVMNMPVARRTSNGDLFKPATANLGSDYALLPVASQTPFPSATSPGIFGLPPIPGTPQTPATEAVRGGNINLGALFAWLLNPARRFIR
jgi:hypothetical protein